MQNYKGHNDSTDKAEICRIRHRKKRLVAPAHLFYLLGEAPGFPDTEMILEKRRTCRKHTEKERKPSKKDKKSIKKQ